MTIEIEDKPDELTKEVWLFYLFGITLVLIGWHRYKRKSVQQAYIVESYWKNKMISYNDSEEPEIPEVIKESAVKALSEMIKVISWSKYKNL